MKKTKYQKLTPEEAEIVYVHRWGYLKGQGLSYGLRPDDPLRKKHRDVYNNAVKSGKKFNLKLRRKK